MDRKVSLILLLSGYPLLIGAYALADLAASPAVPMVAQRLLDGAHVVLRSGGVLATLVGVLTLFDSEAR